RGRQRALEHELRAGEAVPLDERHRRGLEVEREQRVRPAAVAEAVRAQAREHGPERIVAEPGVEAEPDPGLLRGEPLDRAEDAAVAVRLDDVHDVAEEHGLRRRRDKALGKALLRDLPRRDLALGVHARDEQPTLQRRAVPARVADHWEALPIERQAGPPEAEERADLRDPDGLPTEGTPADELDRAVVAALNHRERHTRLDAEL